MKLAFVTHTLYPDFIGGREHHVHHLARAFSKGHDVVVIGGGRVRKPATDRDDGYKRVRLPMLSLTFCRNPLQVYRMMPGLKRALEKERPDLVHVFEYGADSMSVAHAYARKSGRPFFLTIYGYVLGNTWLRLGKKLYDHCVGKNILESAEGIYCVSKTQYDEVRLISQKPFKSGRIRIQENGVMCSDFLEQGLVGQQERGGGVPLRVLSASRILPRKNIKTLVLAVEELVREMGFKDIQLSIAGPDCGDSKDLQELIDRLGLHGHVQLIGELPYGHVAKIMRQYDVFALLSFYEGLPLSVLEAMACGRAVIFSDCDVGRRMITHNVDGILVDPRDVKSVARVLFSLSQDRRRCFELGVLARRKALQFDSFVEMAAIQKDYDKVFVRYQGVLGRGL